MDVLIRLKGLRTHIVSFGVFVNTCFIVGLMCIFTPTWAQETDSVHIKRVKEVRIAGQRSTLRQTSATPVQVLNGNDLHKLHSFSVADALRYFSGLQVKDYGGVGGLKTINVRSLGSNHTAVFYDGVQVGNAQNGQIDLGKFTLDNVEEIALYNGQNSNIFQPARSYGSASSVYLRSKQPKFENGVGTNIRAGFKTGSFGLVNPSLQIEQKLSPQTSATLSSEWVQANGRYRFRYTNGVYDTTATRNNTDIDALRLEAGLNGTLHDSASWSLKAYGYSSERGLPGAIVSNKFDYSQRQWDRNLFIQGHFETSGNSRYSLMLNAKYANDYLRYLDPEFITVQGPLDNHFRQQEFYFSAANRYNILPNWDIALSADYQQNTLAADLYHFPYPTRQTILAALASAFSIGRFSLQASLLATFVADRVKMYTAAGNKQEWTPTIMATFYPANDKRLMFRAFYKNIFRLPTFNDLYYTFVGNALLRPEFADQYNIGLTYSLAPGHGVLSSISLQADAYYNEVKDKIVAIPSLNIYRWTMYNIGRVAIKGAELNLQSAWAVFPGVAIQTTLNYTFQQARDITGTTRYRYNIPYVPLHSGSFTLSTTWKKLDVNYSYIYAGERYNQLSTDQNFIYNYMEPWYTHDAGIAYNMKRLKITMEINNLFDQDRDVIANFPMPGRFYRIKMGLEL